MPEVLGKAGIRLINWPEGVDYPGKTSDKGIGGLHKDQKRVLLHAFFAKENPVTFLPVDPGMLQALQDGKMVVVILGAPPSPDSSFNSGLRIKVNIEGVVKVSRGGPERLQRNHPPSGTADDAISVNSSPPPRLPWKRRVQTVEEDNEEESSQLDVERELSPAATKKARTSKEKSGAQMSRGTKHKAAEKRAATAQISQPVSTAATSKSVKPGRHPSSKLPMIVENSDVSGNEDDGTVMVPAVIGGEEKMWRLRIAGKGEGRGTSKAQMTQEPRGQLEVFVEVLPLNRGRPQPRPVNAQLRQSLSSGEGTTSKYIPSVYPAASYSVAATGSHPPALVTSFHLPGPAPPHTLPPITSSPPSRSTASGFAMLPSQMFHYRSRSLVQDAGHLATANAYDHHAPRSPGQEAAGCSIGMDFFGRHTSCSPAQDLSSHVPMNFFDQPNLGSPIHNVAGRTMAMDLFNQPAAHPPVPDAANSSTLALMDSFGAAAVGSTHPHTQPSVPSALADWFSANPQAALQSLMAMVQSGSGQSGAQRQLPGLPHAQVGPSRHHDGHLQGRAAGLPFDGHNDQVDAHGEYRVPRSAPRK
ncbi:hypothetical protein OE88DRAFT_1735372 [Heliocybe sulcata]|uniref:Uncharacterized protein n=1 Tax=Heliocybe sulcata TaxID=5364 RepID=A0A5C3N1G8_9AGAM|nr:hypothetical protein OE88DRAFT_1735372 [Heliocybe sulcata]